MTILLSCQVGARSHKLSKSCRETFTTLMSIFPFNSQHLLSYLIEHLLPILWLTQLQMTHKYCQLTAQSSYLSTTNVKEIPETKLIGTRVASGAIRLESEIEIYSRSFGKKSGRNQFAQVHVRCLAVLLHKTLTVTVVIPWA